MASKSWIVAVAQKLVALPVLADAAVLETGKCYPRHAELGAAVRGTIDAAEIGRAAGRAP